MFDLPVNEILSLILGTEIGVILAYMCVKSADRYKLPTELCYSENDIELRPRFEALHKVNKCLEQITGWKHSNVRFNRLKRITSNGIGNIECGYELEHIPDIEMMLEFLGERVNLKEISTGRIIETYQGLPATSITIARVVYKGNNLSIEVGFDELGEPHITNDGITGTTDLLLYSVSGNYINQYVKSNPLGVLDIKFEDNRVPLVINNEEIKDILYTFDIDAEHASKTEVTMIIEIKDEEPLVFKLSEIAQLYLGNGEGFVPSENPVYGIFYSYN